MANVCYELIRWTKKLKAFIGILLGSSCIFFSNIKHINLHVKGDDTPWLNRKERKKLKQRNMNLYECNICKDKKGEQDNKEGNSQ